MRVRLVFDICTNAREALRFLEKLQEYRSAEIWYDGDRRSWMVEVRA